MNKLCFSLQSFRGSDLNRELSISQSQLLIGRASSCDFVIDSDEVSFYSCLISATDSESVFLVSLDIDNQVIVNGTRVHKCDLLPGDKIIIGEELFIFDESTSVFEFTNTNGKARSLLDIPAIPENAAGLELIDDEYCDIYFPNIPDVKISKDVFENISFDESCYEQLTEKVAVTEENFSHSSRKVAKVSIICNGNIVSIDMHDYKENTRIDFSRNEGLINKLFVDGEELNIKFSNDVVIINSGSLTLGQKSVVDFHYFQVLIEYISLDKKIRPGSFYENDKNFNKEILKSSGAFFLLLLISFFTDTTIPQKIEKKMAIIYKRPTSSVAKIENTKSTKDLKASEKTGHVEKKTKTLKVSASSAKSSSKKIAKKKVTAKSRSIASVKKPKVVKQRKTFKLNMNSNVSSFLSSKSKVNEVNINDSTSDTSVAAASASTFKSINNNVGTVGNLDVDTKGLRSFSGGAVGFAKKGKIDTSYMKERTVILGSIDPDLLRKILREHLPQFRHCYQEELENSSDELKGIVDLNFRITKSGSATNIKIAAKRNKFSKTGVNCMSRVLSLISFPRPKGGGYVDITQPLNFFSERKKI